MTPDDDIIDAIYAAGSRRGSWDEAIGMLGARLRAANGALYAEKLPGDAGSLSLADFAVEFGYERRDLVRYAEHYSRLNPFSLHAARMFDGRPGTDVDLDLLRLPGFRFAETEFYRDWARPQGVRHVLGQYVEHLDSGRLTVAFWRPADAGPHEPSEIAMLGASVRHLRRAIEMDGRLRLADAEMRALLDRSGAAVVTLGRDGRVRQCNAAADTLFGLASGLSVRKARLLAAVPQDQAALDRLIACVFDARRRSWAEHARVAIRRTDGRPPLVLRIAGLGHLSGLFAPDRAATAILTIGGFEAENERLAERLRRRFGLTPAQIRLALALRSGGSLREAARAVGIGQETARTHLKAVFARTGAHRQAELLLFLRELDQG